MIERIFGLVGAGALLFGLGLGCASNPDWSAAGVNWGRDDTSYEQFEVDRTACEAQDAESPEACLRRRGYWPFAERNQFDRARDALPSL